MPMVTAIAKLKLLQEEFGDSELKGGTEVIELALSHSPENENEGAKYVAGSYLAR
eukprot:m.128281 g.128281  ORF g.128281 m.128281 type:complete len:55 (-) comp17425_c0_seq2:2200-2364(-)